MLNSITSSRLWLFFSLFTLFSFFHFPVSSFKYLGCYQDRYAASDRDLVGSLYLEDHSMSPEFCEQKCSQASFKYFGLQYGSECWCGNSYGKYGELPATACSAPCANHPDTQCGGELVNSVYEVTNPSQPRAVDDSQPLLGLVMIVKDEAHTLPNTLLPLKPYIDWYYILDTGSTDGTQDAIRRTLGDNGEIWEEPFIDYGTSRNRALEIAQQGGKSGKIPVFSLMLSADETVYNADSLRRFCEENRYSEGTMHEAYPIQMDVGVRFDSLRLSRTNKGWRYVGKVHEYLASPDRTWHPTLRVPNTYIKFRVTDPERRSNREYKIRDILERERIDNPTDTRTAFYLARTYNVIGNHSAALDEFRRRVSLGGWQEEVYESLYAIAFQHEALGHSWPDIQQAFLDAYEHSPERAEPLYAIASHYYKQKNLALTYLYASQAAALPYPRQAVLWVQNSVYEWQSNFLVGMSALRLGSGFHEIGAIALNKAWRVKSDDPIIIQQRNKYREVLGEEKWKRIENGDVIDQPLPSPIEPERPAQEQQQPANPAPRANPQQNGNAAGQNTNSNGQAASNGGFGSGFTKGMPIPAVESPLAVGAVVFAFVLVLGLFITFIALRRKKQFRGIDGTISDKLH